jgi:hypothetical protein
VGVRQRLGHEAPVALEVIGAESTLDRPKSKRAMPARARDSSAHNT